MSALPLTDVVMPRLSDSMEEGTINRWLRAVDDAVQVGDELVEIETDKATQVYESDVDGTLLEVLAAEGDTVAVGVTIARIGDPDRRGDVASPGGSVAAAEAPAGAVAPAPPAKAATPPTAVAAARIPASPLARRRAETLGVDLAQVTGTGPRGRITREDVEAAAAAPPPDPTPSAGTAPDAPGGTTRVPLNATQRTVAKRMTTSKATAPDFQVSVEVDMTEVLEVRERLRAGVDDAEPVPSLNDFVVLACARALRAHPRANGTYTDEAFVLHEQINVGVAVAANDGLLVPTVFDADRKRLREVAAETRELAEAARNGTLSAAQLGGGTFTVSNLGMFGIDAFVAVLNPPQAAILAVGAVRRVPDFDAAGQVVARQRLTATLSADHRILYGADAAAFVAMVRDLLEHPLALLT